MRSLVFMFTLLPLLAAAEEVNVKDLLEAINSLRNKEAKLPPLHFDNALEVWTPPMEAKKGPVFCWVSGEGDSLEGLVDDRSAVWGAFIQAEGRTPQAAFSRLISDPSARRLLLSKERGWRYVHIAYKEGALQIRLVGVRPVSMSVDAWVMLVIGALLLFGGVALSLMIAVRRRNDGA